MIRSSNGANIYNRGSSSINTQAQLSNLPGPSPQSQSRSRSRSRPRLPTSTPSATTISIASTTITFPESSNRDYLDDELSSILINSDPSECNETFSIFLKCIIDNIYVDTDNTPTYQDLSLYALRLLVSNMFSRNYKYCVGKILALLETFAAITEGRLASSNIGINTISSLTTAGTEHDNDNYNDKDNDKDKVRYESECLKEFLCITLLLLLKIKNSTNEKDIADNASGSSGASSTSTDTLDIISIEEVFTTLQQGNFFSILCYFITVQIKAVEQKQSSFVILKFGCDLMFEYLYYMEILSSKELLLLAKSDNKLVGTTIKHLLSSESFNAYDLDSDDEFHDESRLIAYEEMKLLLLINEQFLMSSYSTNSANTNKVFEELIHNHQDAKSNVNNIVGFINLLIFHLNREESQIIKLLILKFLYLVFTTSMTAKLIYRNDLKILVDIFIRELDNLMEKDTILILTYLRVLYPILMFSELNECGNYKSADLVNVLGYIITNSELKRERSEHTLMSDLATKCMNIKWLKKSALQCERKVELQRNPSPSDVRPNSSSGSSESNSPESEQPPALPLFTRVASMRTSMRSDYHKHTTTHNILERKNSEKKSKPTSQTTSPNLFEENNNNVFLAQFSKHANITTNETFPFEESPLSAKDKDEDTGPTTDQDHNQDHDYDQKCHDTNILDLPNEYLTSKPLPKLPVPQKLRHQLYKLDGSATSSSSSINSDSSIKRKALKKKAPPPPPPPPRRSK
ncbi:pre-rRNA processing [Lodderomyces elongisporus]|uniref:pre-rRNA processing n=1 Tax=Lodderomyces elongisporus TaxID=36914 RepID=UPI00292075E5|nr:pre-rRNA processing [Lodderomyces elongisporus]WLF76783.1 pre-rRNA processing [Lodderomyces elongisporus]